ncbi:RNA-directed DNA polymerase like [Apostasia shenzhenica]|uniref:RNA-directed DNA polymerase like n=1 Tax=Apostasia shenzhenica TaxID=1088818 RepID=A0A2I0AT35_9ASPA|nr:RNA-directed DNA polymerase like [Apostasia shenzhenica]
MVKKANGKWRMCIDFRALNQACPKDTYPLPRIDMMVDRTSGYDVMSFFDAFSGYHQIRMAKEDQKKLPSSLTLALIVTMLCPSVSKMPAPPISA